MSRMNTAEVTDPRAVSHTFDVWFAAWARAAADQPPESLRERCTILSASATRRSFRLRDPDENPTHLLVSHFSGERVRGPATAGDRKAGSA